MKKFSLKPKTLNYYWIGAGVLFLFLALTYLLRPISDPDFFWHLKTGEWIWQHGSLPAADPFTFTGPASPDGRQLQILQGYWLAQLLYYGLYSVWGWWGIYLLRLAIVAGFLGLFSHWISKERPNMALAASAVLLFFLSLLESYPLERPQVFSFLFFAALFSLYQSFMDLHGQEKVWKNWVLVFFLMAFWANMHGGVILGQGFLLVAGAIHLLRDIAKKKYPFKKEYFFYFFGIAGSCLKPTGISFDVFSSIVDAKNMKLFAYNYEYYSMYRYFEQFNDYMVLLNSFIILVSFVLLLSVFKNNKYIVFIFLVIVCIFSIKHVRYIPFALIMFVIISTSVSRKRIFEKIISGLLIIIVLTGGIYFLRDEFGSYREVIKYGFVNQNVFPVKAADFIVKNKVEGKFFNTFAYGGYLLWRLGPEQKIYQDGRVLNEAAFIDGLSCEMNMRGGSGRPLWKDIMDKYGISVAILTRFSSGRQPYELTSYMARDPDWTLLYYDETSVIFSRKATVPFSN